MRSLDELNDPPKEVLDALKYLLGTVTTWENRNYVGVCEHAYWHARLTVAIAEGNVHDEEWARKKLAAMHYPQHEASIAVYGGLTNSEKDRLIGSRSKPKDLS